MLSDFRYACRSFLKAPGLAAVIVVTLALGIGATTAIFSAVDAVLLRPSPLKHLERLAMIWETDRNTGTSREPASFPDFVDFKSRASTLTGMAAMMAGEVNLTPEQGDPVRLPVLNVSANLASLLEIQPIAGRTFTAEEDRPNGPQVVLISDRLWERRFERRVSALGATLRLDDRPWTIVGVMPADADFGVLQILSAAAYSRGFADRGLRTNVDVWMPLQADPEQLPRSTHPIFVVGRLPENGHVAPAQAELTAIAADLERAYPENAARGVHVESLDSVVFGPVRPALFILLSAVALLLLVACVNVANLLLARAADRQQEVAVRCALGASPARLARQAFAEALLLAVAGAISGLALAFAGLRSLVAIAPSGVPRLTLAAINVPVLLTTLAIALAIAVLFGLLPSLQRGRTDLQATLIEGPFRTSAGRRSTGVRRALVVSELTLAVVLVCAASLLVRSFWNLQHVDSGFQTEGVLKAEYQLPPSRYPVDFRRWPDFKEQHTFNAALLARAAALPGVSSAAIAGNHPLDPGFTNSFTIVGREAEAQSWPEISIRRVSPSYFTTVALGLTSGRYLRDSDGTNGSPVVLLNTAAARRFFGDRDPIGARMRFWGAARTIVGVVADEKFQGLAEPSPIAAYVPIAQAPSANGAGVLLVRTTNDPSLQESAIAAAIHDVDPALAVFAVEPLQITVSRSVGQQRFTMLLLGLFAAVALALAAIGIHGVLSHAVSQRRREIGIRVALGAQTSDLVRLVGREAFMLTAIGTATGLVGASALTRFLRSQLFGVTAGDPVTFGTVAAILAVVAAAAMIVPARRAAGLNPVLTLRGD